MSCAHLNINYGQKGIADLPDYALYVTITLPEHRESAYPDWLKTAQVVDKLCAATDYQTVCICGVDFQLWRTWCEINQLPTPELIFNYQRLQIPPFQHTGGDLWFHIKGNSVAECQQVLQGILAALADYNPVTDTTLGDKSHGGKVFGGCFIDGMINPVDPVNLSSRVIIGNEDPDYRGATCVLQQKFVHNWDMITDMTAIERENMIGRNLENTILPTHDDRSHIKCVVQETGERVTLNIFRQALPFGQSASGRGNEEGVYFAAYGKSTQIFDDLISGIQGDKAGYIKDKMLNVTCSVLGNYWFIPSAANAGLTGSQTEVEVPINPYFEVRSANGKMFYNNRDFLHQVKSTAKNLEISDRIVNLIADNFNSWNDTWSKPVTMPSVGHLQDYLQEPAWQEYKDVATASTTLRKGLAIKISLSDVLLRPQFTEQANLFTIKPNEIIVGNMPPFTLGTGTQVMEYLSQDEKIEFFFGTLNEYSATGHNVPDYGKALRLGVTGLLEEAEAKLAQANSSNQDFYQSVVWSLEGLRNFIQNYANLALNLYHELPESHKAERANLLAIAERMSRLANDKPHGFLESIQLIFIINCALHQIGEPMSIGRLDQLLHEVYIEDIKSRKLCKEAAQEILDAFWLKMDETVLYNRQNMQDYMTYGTGAVFYSAGNFPQGSALNQWVQQVTVGGYLPNDDETPTDASNILTLLCLRSARRLPLNAPCLSLRLTTDMNTELHEEIITEAANALLSGGAHPVLINDDKLIKGLLQSGPLTLADARDYTCDGCYEPIIAGKTEWAFSYVPILPVVGMAMNQGATIDGAGWMHLRGMKSGWNSPPPAEIKTFAEFMEIFYTQYKWQISAFYNALMSSYGALGNVCPSPLFSAMVDGCMEHGRDMTNGGAKYHFVAPMMCGITNAINSLYAINKLVYDKETAVTTLPVLLEALWNNWGETMQEPFQNVLAGPARAADVAAGYKTLRQYALSLPKFGRGDSPELKQFADEVVERCVKIIRDGIDNPLPPIAKAYASLKEKYAINSQPFEFTVTPGIGTFEDNVGLGAGMGASADGRLSGETLADDFSAAPSPIDLPPMTQPYNIFEGLKDWNVESISVGLSNAAPVDVNIREDFPAEQLREVIRQFAQGKIGSNLLTITTTNPETYAAAQNFPEKYDIVRVRMGGWSEFYMAMFPQHQQNIIRRPYYGVS